MSSKVNGVFPLVLFILMIAAAIALTVASCRNAGAQEDCKHGTLQCVSLATQRIREMGWDFHRTGDIVSPPGSVVLPVGTVMCRFTWTPPTTGEPGEEYKMQLEWVGDVNEIASLGIISPADSVRLRVQRVDAQDRWGEWSEWSLYTEVE